MNHFKIITLTQDLAVGVPKWMFKINIVADVSGYLSLNAE